VSDEDRLFSETGDGAEHSDDAGTNRAGAGGGEAIEQAPPAEQLSDSIPGAALAYDSVEDWVSRYLLVMYRRAVSGTGTTWCPQWWRHPEAVVRLEALWRAWEYLRKDETTGVSVWLRDHCDPHMTQLLSADGPFKGCKPKQHSGHPNEPLPCDRAPAGWFEQIDGGDLPVAAVGRA
jgi:hypothetical protein